MEGALGFGTHPRAKALSEWAKSKAAARGKDSIDINFDESAAQLREILQLGLMKMTDLRDDPEWFFEAHRIIAWHAKELGLGFWTRFMVQFNLFAGTILATGNEEQVKQLKAMQENGDLGCFGLTEKFAGVSSGMIVETIADFDSKAKEYVLMTPNEGAKKNWISQGFCADKSVVIADLRIDGNSHGPHAFLIDFRVTRNGKKELTKGVSLADMGRKTVANDLDNAWIKFDNVRVPASCLLDRFTGVDLNTNKFVEKVKGVPPMMQVGQRLFTGRVAVAEASLISARWLFTKVRGYTDNKKCWAPKGARPPLSMLPQLSSLFAEADDAFEYAEKYAKLCEAQLIQYLPDRMPSVRVMDGIAVLKIRAVETGVQLCFRLKQAVGSHAIMADSGFEGVDGLQIAKFAEGESMVLMQKLARDRVKSSKVSNSGKDEEAIVADLAKANPMEWVTQADRVYHLAELVMDRTMEEWVGSSLPRGVARPWAAARL
jgi:alkylation response protein AidB-like acyl-CoA dehydrogenase